MLVHNFYIVDKSFIDKHIDSGFIRAIKNEKGIEIEDDIILFIWETLKWIQTQNYMHKKMWGLNYDGITIIPQEQIAVLKSLVKTWIIMFSFAPNLVCISKNDGKVTKEALNRELNSFVELMDEAINKNALIAHIGI